MADPITACLALCSFLYNVGSNIEASDLAKDSLKALVTEPVGATMDSLLKGAFGKATSLVINRFKADFTDEYGRPLNHDLQKAVRKAQLLATLSAIRACRGELLEDEHLHRTLVRTPMLKNVFETPEERWLTDLEKRLVRELKNQSQQTYIPSSKLNYKEILTLANPQNDSQAELAAQKLVLYLKEFTWQEIEPHDIEIKYLSSAESAPKKLNRMIFDGWMENTGTDESFKVDWFRLLTEFFSEEYKQNQRVQAAFNKIVFFDLKSEQEKFATKLWQKLFDDYGEKLLSKLDSIEKAIVRFEIKQDRTHCLVEQIADDLLNQGIETVEDPDKSALFYLQIWCNGNWSQEIPIKQRRVIVGRRDKEKMADVQLITDNAKISRRQLVLNLNDNGVFTVEVLGKNSVIVKGKEVSPGEKMMLRKNDEIEIYDFRLRLKFK